ncbi:hypothetical protein ABZZ16_17445, partial [Streptomyces sp. NPDC006386]
MSQSFDYADGATGGEPQGPPPNVYLPQAAPPPAYDGYADPAAAHGWQDEGAAGGVGATRELPVVPAGGRSGAGHRARRRKSPWRTRRVAVAAGAVGAVSAAALIAGFSFSGSSSGTRGGEGGRTGPTAGESPAAVVLDGQPHGVACGHGGTG